MHVHVLRAAGARLPHAAAARHGHHHLPDRADADRRLRVPLRLRQGDGRRVVPGAAADRQVGAVDVRLLLRPLRLLLLQHLLLAQRQDGPTGRQEDRIGPFKSNPLFSARVQRKAQIQSMRLFFSNTSESAQFSVAF